MKKFITLLILNIFDYFYKKKIISFIKRKIKKIKVLVDVGAHHGESIELFTKNFLINEIYAFEPSSSSFNKLLNKLNKINNKSFRAYNIGLANKEGTVKLNNSLDSASSTVNFINKSSNYYKKKIKFLGASIDCFFSSNEKIKITTLDKFFKKKIINIDLIKIDTEGFEYSILLGAKKMLKKTKFIFFEHHFDDMIIKKYKYSDIHYYLISNNFEKISKFKMPFRKSFEYIYQNISIK